MDSKQSCRAYASGITGMARAFRRRSACRREGSIVEEIQMKKVLILTFALIMAGPAFAQSSGAGGGNGTSSGSGMSQGTEGGMNTNRPNSGLPGGHPGNDMNKPANGDHGNNGANGG
jgi:hypothetical protein